MKKSVCFIIFLLFAMQLTSAALGISPARKNIDFVPGQEHHFDYTVLCDDPSQQIFLYAEGDLAQYVTLSKETIVGQDSFSVTLKLPDSVELPGTHTLLIGAREKPDEGSFLNTAINIRATISVFVPYPGRYASISLDAPSGNTGSSIPIEAKVKNLGKEDLEVTTRIDFNSQDGKLVQSMQFDPVLVKSGSTRSFGRYLNTTDILPGSYIANAVASYGNTINASVGFKVGSLFVNITNYTTELGLGGIKRFDVGVESFWNDPVPALYASVNISNESYSLLFQTPSVSLPPWGTSVLSGFIDTANLGGEYLSSIVLYYGDHTTSASGNLAVSSGIGLTKALVYGLIALAVLIIVAVVFRYVYKNKKTRRRKRR